jgi:dTDP-4-dehydrorhamnose reductase
VNLLILGADSLVGQALAEALTREEQAYVALQTDDFIDLPAGELMTTLTRLHPSQAIYTATFNDIAAAESSEDAARRCDLVNTLGVAAVAEVCQKLQVPLLYHSSSLVFDGRKTHSYREDDETNPQSHYGQSKLAGERALREVLPQHLILRTDWVFDARAPTYFEDLIARFRQGKGRVPVKSLRFCPTPARDVARVLLAVARQVDCAAEAWGTYHYCALQPVAQETLAEYVLQEVAKYDADVAALLPQLEVVKEVVEKPWIANSVLGAQKLFETFGIKQRSRAGALNALLQQLCNYTPAAAPAATEDAPPEPEPEPERSGTSRRRVRQKPGSAKPSNKDAKQTR